MSLLRIYASIAEIPVRCEWVLVNSNLEIVSGAGLLAELPQRAERVQFVIPARQVLITRTRIPQQARRRAGSVLAFAIEEQTVDEPDKQQVNWLGTTGNAAVVDDVLAVVDKQALLRWRNALAAVGIRNFELHCEMLLLPRAPGEWSLAWDGGEGFVRSGEIEGVATDRGDRNTPPLSLHLLRDEAEARGERPASIALYATQPDAMPDMAAWQHSLGVPCRFAGSWDWRKAPPDAGVSLAQELQRWRAFTGLAARLRPAAMILGAALSIQAMALTIDWILLAREQRALRQNMETQFRAVFPDAVAVVDPVLQMRRKLAEARHSAGLADEGDFLPMIEHVAAAMNDQPPGKLRLLSYESGRLTLELDAGDAAAAQRVVQRLQQAGLSADVSPAALRPENGTLAPQSRTQTLTIVVRTS